MPAHPRHLELRRRQAGLEPHWRDVAAYGDRHFPQAGAHFADVHYALVAAAARDEAWSREARQAARH
jgi:hypothetical protein